MMKARWISFTARGALAIISSIAVASIAVMSSAVSVAHADLEAECLGEPGAPVGAIYLHGLFRPHGEDVHGWRALERANRAQLARTARELGIRIAVPKARKAKSLEPAGVIYWSSTVAGEDNAPTALTEISEKARDACHVSNLEPPLDLIGFSNGADRARLMCGEKNQFAKIIAIDFTNSDVDTSGCGRKLVNINGGHSTLDKGDMPDRLAAELRHLKAKDRGALAGSQEPARPLVVPGGGRAKPLRLPPAQAPAPQPAGDDSDLFSKTVN